MLEQQVHECLAAIAPRGCIQEVRVLLTQGGIDEAAWLECKRRPVERLGQHRRQDSAQRAAGVLGLAEHGLEDQVVRVRNHPRGHRRGPGARKASAWAVLLRAGPIPAAWTSCQRRCYR